MIFKRRKHVTPLRPPIAAPLGQSPAQQGEALMVECLEVMKGAIDRTRERERFISEMRAAMERDRDGVVAKLHQLRTQILNLGDSQEAEMAHAEG